MTTQTERMREAQSSLAKLLNAISIAEYEHHYQIVERALAGALAQPEQPGLIVSVCHLGDGDDPFVFQCHGRVTTSALASIDKALLENRDTHFPDGPGDYEFSLTWDEGQYGFEGRCELAPGWEFEQTGFKPLASPPIGELPHTDVEVRGHKFMVMDLPANFFDAASPTPPQAEQELDADTRYLIRRLLSNRYHYSHDEFAEKLEEIVATIPPASAEGVWPAEQQ